MARISVLIVDDEEIVLIAISGLLAMRSFDVHTASNGGDALDLIKSEQVDVAVVDMMMPGKDGVQFISELQSQYPNTRIVAMSGLQQVLKRVETANIRTLEKPFAVETLISIIEDIVGNQNSTSAG